MSVPIDIAKIRRLGQDSKDFLQNLFELLRQGRQFTTKREKASISVASHCLNVVMVSSIGDKFSISHRRPAFLSVKSSFSGRLDLKRQERESARQQALSLSFLGAGLEILPRPSLAYATRCAQGRQDRRRHRCDNLHNPLKSLFLSHNRLIDFLLFYL